MDTGRHRTQQLGRLVSVVLSDAGGGNQGLRPLTETEQLVEPLSTVKNEPRCGGTIIQGPLIEGSWTEED